MIKNYLFLFALFLSINNDTKTAFSLNTKIEIGITAVASFLCFASYKYLYKNSIKLLPNKDAVDLTIKEWKKIPFFKRLSIKKYYRLCFQSLYEIAEKHAVSKSFEPVCTQPIVTVDFLNKISSDFKKNSISRDEAEYFIEKRSFEKIDEKIKKEAALNKNEHVENKYENDQDKNKILNNFRHKKNASYLNNFIQQHIKNRTFNRNIHLQRDLEKNIDKLVYGRRLEKIIDKINVKHWKVPKLWIISDEDAYKLINKKIEGDSEFVLNLEATKELLALALSTGLSDLENEKFSAGNILYDENESRYYLTNLEKKSFVVCENQLGSMSKKKMSPIDITFNIFLKRKNYIDDEGIIWLAQFYNQLIQNSQEWEAFRKGKDLNMIPLYENTTYDEELFGKTPNIKRLERLLREKEKNKEYDSGFEKIFQMVNSEKENDSSEEKSSTSEEELEEILEESRNLILKSN